MATKKRPVLIRVQPYNYDKLKAIADKNRRSVSNQLEYLMIQYIENYEKENGEIPLMGENKEPGVSLKVSGNNYFSNNNNSFNTTAV